MGKYMLGDLPDRALETYRSEGLQSVVIKGNTLVRNKVKNKAENGYWRIKGTKQLYVDGTGATFDVRSQAARKKAESHCRRESELLSDLIDTLEPDDVFWDVGANIGVFSCFAAQKLIDGSVIAFEPFPPNVQQLEKNLSHNENDTEILVKNIALSDSTGDIEFTSPETQNGLTSKSAINPNGETITVETYPADELVQGSPIAPPDIVKIDVEGVEPLVLQGMTNILRNHCRVLYCEIHPKESNAEHTIDEFGETVESLISLITDQGFTIVHKERRHNEVQIKAEASK